MPKRSRQEWETIVAEFHASGEDKATFAARYDIRPKTLAWWVWSIGRANGDETTAEIELVPVEFPRAAAPGPSAIELEYKGLKVRLPAGTSVEFVGAVLLDLRSTC